MNSINNENNMEDLYNDLFVYRITIQDISDDETYIIKELKLYLILKRYNINNINNILFDFYNYFDINIDYTNIENTRIFVFNYTNFINSINNSNLLNNIRTNNNNNNNNNNTNNNTNNNNNNNTNENIDNNTNENIDNNTNENIDNNTNENIDNNTNENIDNNTDENIEYYNIGRGNNLYHILTQFIGLTDRLERYEDVVVSLDTEELNKLKTYEHDNSTTINCSICIDKIKDKEIICELNCTHQFHESCIKTYLDKYNYKCPICRESTGKTKTNI